MAFNQSVVSSKSFELVGGSDEGQTSQLGDLSGNLLSKADVGVETLRSCETRVTFECQFSTYSTDGSTTLSEHVDARQRALNALDAVLDLSHIAAELLTQCQGSCVLQVSATNLDDVVELVGLGLQCSVQLLERGQQVVVDFHRSSNVHGGGEAKCGQYIQ